MIYSIVPDLVSLKTDQTSIPGFYLSEDFTFFGEAGQKSYPFEYSLFIDNFFEVPEEYDLRSGYFSRLGDIWYYSRKLGPIEFKFSFNQKTRECRVNSLFMRVPFELGGVLPAGRLLSDIITLDLFLKGYHVFYGCAVKWPKKGATCLIGYGYNGKTSFVIKSIEKGAAYIAEDLLVLDFKNKIVYPTALCHKPQNFARLPNKGLSKQLTNQNKVSAPIAIDSLKLIQNTTSQAESSVPKTLSDYIYPCSLLFLKSNLVRLMISDWAITDQITAGITHLQSQKDQISYINLHNFNYDSIN